jgi:hypothetical protein
MAAVPSDSDLARAVRCALSELNNALRQAHDAGLHVEIGYGGHYTVARRDPLRIYSATVERREVIS